MPKYTAPAFQKVKDLHTTIYWKPELTSDKDGNADLKYLNADGTGNYRVVVEGVDDNSRLARQVYRYRVN